MLKHQIIRAVARALLLAVAFLPTACGGAPAGEAPTRGPIVPDTAVPAPTQAAAPATALAIPTTIAPSPTATSPAATAALPGPPTAAPPTARTSPADTASVVITYHKSGGIAGVDETLTVYADGSIVLEGRAGEARAQASPADIQALQALLASPELAALGPSQPPPVADAFVYELTIPGRAQPIVTADGADIPQVLEQVIMALERLKAEVR